ncbi:carbamoyltransferase C-terminal domain-containing protein [Sphaerisporangium flaviroseum]|uniref:Carbamoyltransferase C-terminal domain-containing protein n=1 Tax=Sphaerisporangium flaviroseum TaxID=509199 RepID=A0ABP7HJI7_9ACTN
MKPCIGFGGSIHDFATCLLTDDGRIVAVEDERLSRVRYAYREPDPCSRSLAYCLEGFTRDIAGTAAFGANDMLAGLLNGVREVSGERLRWMNHHYSHALSTFFTSPFHEAAVVVADGAGSVVDLPGVPPGMHARETTSWAIGRGNALHVLDRVSGEKRGGPGSNDADALMSNSLGDLYRAATEAIGFGFLQAGKTMGLAPYGDARFVDRMMEAVELYAGGRYSINMEGKGGVVEILEGIPHGPLDDDFDTNASIAFAVQSCLETILFHVLDEVWDATRSPDLCLAGGVALNCVFNGKIKARTPFERVHVVYAPGDSGTAIGAALHCALEEGCGDRHWRLDPSPYLGHEHKDDGLEAYGRRLAEEELCADVASLLRRDKAVAWFHGGAEFGPRALGNRSILADPSRPEMRKRLNHIKSREQFRPFAPVMLVEHLQEYFPGADPSPYMQFSYPIKESLRGTVGAVCHVDGSARVQTTDEAQNPLLAELLKEFNRQGGPPVLLNTSLNVRGEPIVETPLQALDALARTDLDALVIGDRLIVK